MSQDIRVKICGITRSEDARLALRAGAHALGLVFYPASPRAVDIEQAKAVARTVGPFATLVGLFVNAAPATIDAVLSEVPLQLLQFHGDETADECVRYGRPYIKALRMRPELDVMAAMAEHPHASGFLLDAYRKGVPGGTGETFDWERVPRNPERPVILAGGLTPDNVRQAISATRPYGVDVSGGVEASPGLKDAGKVNQFMFNALNGDQGEL
ncbi:phosphoribosylanthranilate isomerase [Marinimicrobium sp. LS-A18]|uniref:phosphoribosylanthranilate isomerase n=1 Tax=Marinimicrobium sp. LS-A18 TaxID=1381596 RepID=UPI0004B40742|nr:phosphoribosylanthranilate isomerase [Marinimicrobium sp. LS-A18]